MIFEQHHTTSEGKNVSMYGGGDGLWNCDITVLLKRFKKVNQDMKMNIG